MKIRARKFWIFAAAAGIMIAICAVSAVLVVRSAWFQSKVLERMIAEIQKSSGARVEIGSFRFDWEHLVATASPLVIHGKEPAGEGPLFKAESVSLGLRVISMLERKVDLDWLRIDRPAVRIVFYADGTNNLPLRDQVPWTEDLLNLAVRRYEVIDGVLEYDGRVIPVNLLGERLRIVMNHDRRGPRYRGELSSRVRMVLPSAAPFELETSAAFVIEKPRFEITKMHLATRDSHADLSGVFENPRAPRGDLTLKAALNAKEAVQIFRLPLAPTGSVAFDGRISVVTQPAQFEMNGRLNARGLGYKRDRLEIDGADLKADLHMSREVLSMNGLSLTAQRTSITGNAQLTEWRQFHFDGNMAGLDLRQTALMMSGKSFPWDASVSGETSVDAIVGERATKVRASLIVSSSPGHSPLDGIINAAYDQASGSLTLSDSHLTTADSELQASGTLNQTLALRVRSKNLDELLPAFALVSDSAPQELPLQLRNGDLTYRGAITGPLENPVASGDLSVARGSFQGHFFDQFSGEIGASRGRVRVQNARLTRGATVIQGSGEIDGETVAAQLTVRGAQIAEVLKEAGSSVQVTGTASGSLRISGSLKNPNAEIAAQIENPAGFGEQLDRLRVNLRYSPDRIDVSSGEAAQGGAKVIFSGDFRHLPGDFKNGEIQFEAAMQRVSLTQIRNLAKHQPTLSALAEGKASGTIHLDKGIPVLTAINGQAAARSVAWDQQALGDFYATAETRGNNLTVRATAQVRDIKMDAQGSWRLEGDYPGFATLHASRASLASVSSLVGGPLAEHSPPFDGFFDGANAEVSVALRKPLDFRAELTIPVMHISPRSTQELRLGAQAQELVIENSKPVVISISGREAVVRSAQLRARDTHLEASGAISFDPKAPSDLSVDGSINLIILQLLSPDLVARGNATLQASIRGSLKDPQLNGRMQLSKASLYLGDVPNGVENVNGTVVFDRNRATIEKLSAETGGGTVNFSGFLGFGTPLVYRLQANAQKVRVRSPGDISVTFNSNLALNGTSDSSTVSGVVTLTRASFTPRADVAELFAKAFRPVSTPAAPSEYLRDMQFDVRIETDPAFELQTSLARNLQAEVNLRLRGTPLRPALLGAASLNEGDVEFFGNRYTVNRGDLRFVNPVRIDPILDMSLETRARGVTVNIDIAGTLQKLNVNYSSDPPMQPREIIALLTVGRAPAGGGPVAPEAASSNATSLAEAGGGLISQALSAQLSSRFQRFFGASRIKIDPTTTGVEYLPQARLTVEQQVSKDVTLTYITNLNRTQEQIVQVEWGFSNQWSAVAVRDASGLFGLDFQYRKRFK